MFKEEVTMTDEISIHALREEGDPDYQSGGYGWEEFLSTPSARRATFWVMMR